MQIRKYWPFPVSTPASEECRREVAFLEEAIKGGYQAYCEGGSVFGVLAENGRNGELVHRGKGRYWEIILSNKSVVEVSCYVDGFANGAGAVLRWIKGETVAQIFELLKDCIVTKPGQQGW